MQQDTPIRYHSAGLAPSPRVDWQLDAGRCFPGNDNAWLAWFLGQNGAFFAHCMANAMWKPIANPSRHAHRILPRYGWGTMRTISSPLLAKHEAGSSGI